MKVFHVPLPDPECAEVVRSWIVQCGFLTPWSQLCHCRRRAVYAFGQEQVTLAFDATVCPVMREHLIATYNDVLAFMGRG